MYDLGDQLLMVASDRISAYDVVLPTPIPDKGKVLTGLSVFWFGRTEDIVPNHLLSDRRARRGARPRPARAQARDLPRRVRRARATCPARAGRSTSRAESVCGIELPAGLRESDRLPEPIFTPATKAELGEHDENIDFDRAAEIVGDRATMEELRRLSLEPSTRAGPSTPSARASSSPTPSSSSAATREGSIVLADEVLTPDSSRFWPADQLRARARRSPRSTSSTCATGSTSPAGTTRRPGPELPADVVANTRAKYVEAYERIDGTAVRALAR